MQTEIIIPNLITDALGGGSVVSGYRYVPKGHLAIETAFTYPDGGSIELYIPKDDLFAGKSFTLTDYGNTVSWLMDLGIKAWQRPARAGLMDDATEPYAVTLKGAELRIEGVAASGLFNAVLRLAQACLRVADISYTQRIRSRSDFAVQVEEVLAEAELTYEVGYEIAVGKGQMVKADAYVFGRTKRSVLMLLSSGSDSYAPVRAREVYARMSDLEYFKREETRITVWDTSVNFFKDADIDRLRRVSEVIPLDERDRLKERAAA